MLKPYLKDFTCSKFLINKKNVETLFKGFYLFKNFLLIRKMSKPYSKDFTCSKFLINKKNVDILFKGFYLFIMNKKTY